MTTLYEAGIEECKSLIPLKETEAKKEIERTVKQYFETNKKTARYYMLLCNENKDYTVFTVKNHFNKNTLKNIQNTIFECLINRGGIYGAALTPDEIAIELWIKYDEDLSPHCYFFFPCDNAICEV